MSFTLQRQCWHRGRELTRRQAGKQNALFANFSFAEYARRAWRASIAERDRIRQSQAAPSADYALVTQ